ncbi:MAG: HisA/HisF-related TIM barrel protein [Gammaproteobacteria bacterium]|jgi:phosphoribosylformimino-5-aminoimidazole carboxamide ribotide isomerase
MLIIPVIDLMNGQVVHAKHGLRNQYQAIQSMLSSSAVPKAVLSSFLELYPFKVIYIADLDAIQKKGTNQQVILELALQNQQCDFWIDAGLEPVMKKEPDNKPANIKFVLGSENKLPKNEFNQLLSDKPELILSLDFVESKLKENHYLLEDPSLWPSQVITMMLSRIGSNKGIDTDCLNTVIKLAKDKSVYAAGGVRNKEDLIQLKNAKVSGALLASALHNGSITKEDLKEFYSFQDPR